VGEIVQFTVELTNSGPTTLTNVRVSQQFDPQFELDRATAGATRSDNRLTWMYPAIGPNQIARLHVTCRCTEATARACATVSVSADQEIEESSESCVEILVQPTAPPADADDGPTLGPIKTNGPESSAEPRPEEENGRPAGSGQLDLNVMAMGDPVRVGQDLTYIVEITNGRDAVDEQVKLAITLPEGMEFVRSLTVGLLQPIAVSPDKRNIEFTPIAALRAGETVTFRIVARAEEPGMGKFQARLQSRLSVSPVTAEEQTAVYTE
jgi:uncharacterized repeat protein (TIGR01451 family)